MAALERNAIAKAFPNPFLNIARQALTGKVTDVTGARDFALAVRTGGVVAQMAEDSYQGRPPRLNPFGFVPLNR